MYPFLRAWLTVRGARKLPAMGLYDTHVSHHRAGLLDCDMYGELNNGRILTLFELGRWAMAARMGLEKTLRAHRIGFAVAGVSVRYRKRIPYGARYRMQTRMIGYDARFLYIEQSMWIGDTPCHHMLLRAAMRDRNGTVLPRRFMDLAGIAHPSPSLPDWAHAWIDADGSRPWPPEQGPVHHNELPAAAGDG